MTANRIFPAMLLTAFLVISIPAGLYFRKPAAPVISPSEAELAKFTSQPADMSSPPPPPLIFSGLASPLTVPPAQPDVRSSEKTARTTTALPLTTKKMQPIPPRSLGSLPVVSMISYDSETRTAIVDNRVVTEGSELGGGVIVKIEENRVLMRKAGKNLWLTIQ